MSFIPTESHTTHSNHREYNGKADRLKLPPISAMDELLPTRTWAPPTEPYHHTTSLPTPQPEQWKSPPYSCKTELARDTTNYQQQYDRIPSPRYSNTSPIMHQPYTIPNRSPQSPSSHPSYAKNSVYRSEQDVEEVVQQCGTLCKNMLQHRGEILHSNTSSFQDGQPWLDDMIGRANEVLNALLRLRKHQLATKNRRYSNDRLIDEPYRNDTQSDTHSDTWRSSNTRQRKRGKRTTFQGRCHSCNISETPEWRRGPDGARTLCNACGLHYAKLARKQQQQSKSGLESLSEELYTGKLTPPRDDIILNKAPT
ncbi:GATA-domain-containing protein [Backusella circina FSU 941]|nr:GATA-domain-containing protein [Backusella circina FSU 941]